METPDPMTRRRYAQLIAAGGNTAFPLTLHDGPLPQCQPSSSPLVPFYRMDKYVFEEDEEAPGDGLVPSEDEDDENPLAPGMPDQEESDAPWVFPFGWSLSSGVGSQRTLTPLVG